MANNRLLNRSFNPSIQDTTTIPDAQWVKDFAPRYQTLFDVYCAAALQGAAAYGGIQTDTSGELGTQVACASEWAVIMLEKRAQWLGIDGGAP